MTELDTYQRTNLTGPWAGFGFQGHHMFTPEGHHLEPGDMAWWSLTCNIAREWRLMMAAARPGASDPVEPAKPIWHKGSSVIYLREAIRRRAEKRFGEGDPGECGPHPAWAQAPPARVRRCP